MEYVEPSTVELLFDWLAVTYDHLLFAISLNIREPVVNLFDPILHLLYNILTAALNGYIWALEFESGLPFESSTELPFLDFPKDVEDGGIYLNVEVQRERLALFFGVAALWVRAQVAFLGFRLHPIFNY